VTEDGKTFAYAPATEPTVVPAKCLLKEKDPAKWAGALSVSADSEGNSTSTLKEEVTEAPIIEEELEP
jgi:hypothetical protein